MFKNETTLKKVYFRELVWIFLKSYLGVILRSLLFVVFSLLAVEYLVYEVLKDIIGNSAIFLIGGPLLIIFTLILKFLNLIRVERQKAQVINRGKTPTMSYEIEDQIVAYNLSTGGRNYYEYEQISKVVESEHLLVILIKGNLTVVLDKNGFTQGSWEECQGFILQKYQECKNRSLGIY